MYLKGHFIFYAAFYSTNINIAVNKAAPSGRSGVCTTVFSVTQAALLLALLFTHYSLHLKCKIPPYFSTSGTSPKLHSIRCQNRYSNLAYLLRKAKTYLVSAYYTKLFSLILILINNVYNNLFYFNKYVSLTLQYCLAKHVSQFEKHL